MTIYSQHPSRGKIQVLATFRGTGGVTSRTVTSVDKADQAAPIVDALNRISACATVPVSVWDRRRNRHARYPREHLRAIIEPAERGRLLVGAHGLWYQLATLLLHRALADLDTALATVPPPIRLAVAEELETEVKDLQAELTEYSEGIEPERPVQRTWDSDLPFVEFEGGLQELTASTRDGLDRLEEETSPEELRQAVDGLRILCAAHDKTLNREAMLDVTEMSVLDDPGYGDGYYLSIGAFVPSGYLARTWDVHIGQWKPENPEDEDNFDSTGHPVAVCTLRDQPDVSDLVRLLDLSAEGEKRLAAWAATPIGQTLEGTTFVVTERPGKA